MKIVIVQGAFFPVPPLEGGAVEKMWFQLTKEFVRQGHEVVYLSRSYPGLPDSEVIDGVHFLRTSGFKFRSNFVLSNFYDFLYSFQVLKLIPKDSDVIVTNSFWSPILARRQKNKIAVDVARMPKGQMQLYKSVRFLRANSTPVAEAIKNELKPAYHPKVKTIPNPLTFTIDEHSPVASKEKIILYTGRIHPEKGIDLLIEAYLQSELRDWKLMVIGPHKTASGGGGEKYLKKLKDLAGSSNIQFPGPIYDIEKLNTHYQKASVFVYPSLAEKGETFGLAPLEAMAWGTVPIVSDLTCFKDFIDHGKNGLIFDHRSSNRLLDLCVQLKQITQDENMRERLSKQAMKVRETHSVKNIALQFLQLFDS